MLNKEEVITLLKGKIQELWERGRDAAAECPMETYACGFASAIVFTQISEIEKMEITNGQNP